MDTYVYGVLRAPAGERAPGTGVDEQSVEVIRRGDLAAFVSDAPELPVKANRRNLKAHSRVLQEAARRYCVLPMQFGVVMPDRGAVLDELLDARAEWLTEQLEAFEPYVELDLRALCGEEELLRAVVAERSDIARLRASLDGKPPDATYYERIRLGELVAQAVAAGRDAIVRRLEAKLGPLAAATDIGEPLHDEMLANLAFLVERGLMPRFDEAVERLGTDLGPHVALRYVGPLPAYRFIDVGAGTEASWA